MWKKRPRQRVGNREASLTAFLFLFLFVCLFCFGVFGKKLLWVNTGLDSTNTSQYPDNSCMCTGLDMLDWREMTKQIDWWAKQPSQMAFFLEDLKCWGIWDTTRGHHTIGRLEEREVWKEEALDDLLSNDERDGTIVDQMNEHNWYCLKGDGLGNFWETVWSASPSPTLNVLQIVNKNTNKR